jgi:phage/plasmid-like protein (TIGR03299 family)
MASKNYKPVQNLQVAEIMDAIVSEGNATVEVCGALGNGGECWMLSRIPDTFEVTRGDQINNYVLLAWGHDGKHGIAGKVTPTRVVCRNTLRAAGFGKGKWSTSADLYLKHYGDMRVRIAEARDALGLIHKQVETTQEAYKALAAHQVTTEEVRAYFKTLFPEPVKPETPTSAYKEQVNHWLDRYSELISAYESAPGATPGTAWGAYNAVTYYTDHRYPILSNGQWSQSRVQTVAAGSMATVKDKALTEALALL